MWLLYTLPLSSHLRHISCSASDTSKCLPARKLHDFCVARDKGSQGRCDKQRARAHTHTHARHSVKITSSRLVGEGGVRSRGSECLAGRWEAEGCRQQVKQARVGGRSFKVTADYWRDEFKRRRANVLKVPNGNV